MLIFCCCPLDVLDCSVFYYVIALWVFLIVVCYFVVALWVFLIVVYVIMLLPFACS